MTARIIIALTLAAILLPIAYDAWSFHRRERQTRKDANL